MGDACSLQCTKYIVFAFNVIFWIAGIAVLGIGIWIRVEKSQYDKLIGSDLYSVAGFILIGAGSLTLCIGFVGCLGAYKEHKCLLGTYFGLLFLIFGAEVGSAILSYLLFEDVRVGIDSRLNYTIQKEYGYSQFETVKLSIDVLQQELQCCGDLSYTSWLNSQYFKDPVFSTERAGTSVPSSCCIRPSDTTCNKGFPVPERLDKIYTKGCVPRFEQWMKDNLLTMGGVGLGIAMVQLFGMVFSCCLFKALDDKEELLS